MISSVHWYGSNQRRLALIAFAGLRLLFGPSLGAQSTANWTASVGNWSSPSNWNCGLGFPSGCIPSGGTSALIGNGGTASLDAIGSAQQLHITAGQLLINGGSLSIGSELGVGVFGGFGTLTVQAGGRVNTTGTMNLGTGGNGTLNITGGGVVSSQLFWAATEPGSNATVTVDGASSQWNTAGQLVLTAGGNPSTLTVSAGGVVSGGTNTYATGTLTVTGAGSQWNTSGQLWVGDPSILTVSGGGVVNATTTFANGTLTVTGAGSQWNTAGQLVVNDVGHSLTVSSGGVVTSGLTFANGTLTVTGTGSQWNTGQFQVGTSGEGSLTVQDGGVIKNESTFIGAFAGNGSARVTGSGSSLNTGFLCAGCGSTGSLVVDAGASASSQGIYVADHNGDHGTMTVTDPTSRLTYVGTVVIANETGATGDFTVKNGAALSGSSDLTVGNGGNGTLLIAGGGTVQNANGKVGLLLGSNGSVTVTGAGSKWINTGGVFVGGAGQGTVTLQDGGAGQSGNGLDVGVGPGANVTMTVTGSGTSWTNTAGSVLIGDLGTGTVNVHDHADFSTSGAMIVGSGGTGSLQVDGGGSASSATLVLGTGNGGSGVLILSGVVGLPGIDAVASKFTSEGTTIGMNGSGAIYVENGAILSSYASSPLSDPGLIVGQSGTGLLSVTKGGHVEASDLLLGENKGSFGTLTVSDPGSSVTARTISTSDGFTKITVSNKGDLSANGSLSLQNADVLVSGGMMSSAVLWVGNGYPALPPGSFSVLRIDSGGDVYADNVTIGQGQIGQVNVFDAHSTLRVGAAGMDEREGGELVVGGPDSDGGLSIHAGANVSSLNGSIGAEVGSKGDVLVAGIGSSWTISHSLSIGTGGTGTLTLEDNAQVSAADITIGHQGTVRVQESTSTLDGDVTNHGSLILDPSTLNVFGNFTLASDGTLFLDMAGTTTGLFSQLNGSGFGLFQGTIIFDFIGGFVPKPGDSFDVINFQHGADFRQADFQFEGLEPGSSVTEQLTNGRLSLVASSVTSTPEPGPAWLMTTGLLVLSICARRRKATRALRLRRAGPA